MRVIVGYIAAVVAVVLATGAGLLLGRAQHADVVMVYLLGVVVVAMRFGQGPSLVATVLSVVTFDFFFVRPYYSFAVADLRHVVTFAVMFIVAVVISGLTKRMQRAQLAAETERMRSSVLSSVSHDLRTPLAVVTGAASSLLEDDATLGPEARRELLETIHEETQRLARLVRNLLDMTRLSSGALRVTKEWQPLEEVVGSALERIGDRLRERRVIVRLPDDLPLVPFDAVLLEQVLINLLENAAKYAPPREPIEIAARRAERAVTVEVADRGPGIPSAELERVFDKFFRLPREGTTGGAGLGLAICRGVVEAHGGTIWAENRKGGGAVFRFTLPVDGSPPALAA